MTSLQLACHAMATRFELVLHGEREEALRAAAEEAMGEILAVEERLSVYRPESQISRVNERAALEWVRVDAVTFSLLEAAARFHALSGGLFDPSIGPLLHCWGREGGLGRIPRPDMIREARASSGFHLVGLCKSDQAVRFRRPGMRLDFGAIGKGFALDRAAALLREAGVESALLHGGTSSVLAIGRPPGESGWKVAVSLLEPRPPGVMKPGGEEFCIARLADSTLSVSAVSGKGFKVDDCFYGHVLDPRSGRPSKCWDLAAVVSCSATASDALSTALLIGGPGFMRGLKAGGGVEGWLAAGREGVGGTRVKRGGVFASQAKIRIEKPGGSE